jgi:outer membrane receptor for ferric coprogen and ferric-rhodotorulic acid
MATMTDRYIPSWEKKYDPWDLEPDTTLDFGYDEDEESENAKNEDELSLENLADEELELEEDFDL